LYISFKPEKERKRERKTQIERAERVKKDQSGRLWSSRGEREKKERKKERKHVCVCVCVCEFLPIRIRAAFVFPPLPIPSLIPPTIKHD